MFFRRVFSKSEPSNISQPFSAPPNSRNTTDDSSSNDSNHKKLQRRTVSDEKQTKGLMVLQLTPLWEHIIRTRTLPEGLNLKEMFEEFFERLHDPEWQVRQHALRVLVDVLSVMGQNSDLYISRLLPPLIENLGHSAPAVRKGALDALRVYLAETRIPDTVVHEIIELGIEQKLLNEPFTGRLAVGIIIALPSLIQPTLGSQKRSSIIRSALTVLSSKMVQITYQEFALKSIIKIRDMILQREFLEFMPYKERKDFDLLCNVYGLQSSPTNLRDSGIDLNVPLSSESKHSWQVHSNENRVVMDGDYEREKNLWQVSNNNFPNKIHRNEIISLKNIQENMSLNNEEVSSEFNENLYKYNNYEINNNVSSEMNNVNIVHYTTPNLNNKLNEEVSHEIKESSRNRSEGYWQQNNQITSPIRSQSRISNNILNNNINNNKPSPINSFSRNKSPLRRSRSATPTPSPRRTSSSMESIFKSASDTEGTEPDISLSVSSFFQRKETDEINPNDKVIMETEIKLSESTAVTMRILEAQVSQETATESSEEETLKILEENESIMRVLSDSDFDDKIERTPRRVRFGGEIVKMRTPDSDTVNQSDPDEHQETPITSGEVTPVEILPINRSIPMEKTQSIEIEITNDNTKPIQQNVRPKTAGLLVPSCKHEIRISPATDSSTDPLTSCSSDPTYSFKPILQPVLPLIAPPPTPAFLSPKPKLNDTKHSSRTKQRQETENKRRSRSLSAGKEKRKKNVNYSIDLFSPIPQHHEIQVFHNLIRSPIISPTPPSREQRKNSITSVSNETQTENITLPIVQQQQQLEEMAIKTEEQPSSLQSEKLNSWEELGIVSNTTLNDLKSGDWRLRSRAICALEESLKDSNNLALVQPFLDTLLRTLLSSEKHPDVCEDKRRVISNLISRLPLDNLENRVGQIVTGLCRHGGAGSNRVAKVLMQRLPPAVVVLKLLSDDFVHARSAKFRENALQMVLFALMTFPSTYFDISTCVKHVTKSAIDRKKRVRQAALDVIAVLGQISSPKTVIDLISSVIEHRQDSDHLNAAVKARLSRKQLPIVSSDGSVQYSLRIPSPQSNIPTHVFGADIEWIIAGSGSVSPTSLKKRAVTLSQPIENNGKFLGNNGYSSNSNAINRFASRPPHEMLAIGVGVSTVDMSNNFVGGNWRKQSGQNHDDERNSQYILTTALPVRMGPTPQTKSNIKHSNNLVPQSLQNMKLQSRSFPELSDAANSKQSKQKVIDNKLLMLNHENANCRTSKLPVTVSRFPTMNNNDNNYSSQNISPNLKYQSFSVQKKGVILSKGNNINNNNFLPSEYSTRKKIQESLVKQSSLEEPQPSCRNTQIYRLNGNKHLNMMKIGYNQQTPNSSKIYEPAEIRSGYQNERRLSFENDNSINSNRTPSTNSNKSVYQNSISNNTITAKDNRSINNELILSDVSTESDSDNSTPTRVIGTSNPNLDLTKAEDFLQKTALEISRPHSVVTDFRKDSFRKEIVRPKTATILSYDDTPIKSKAISAENLSLKSKTISRENLRIPFDDMPIHSKTPSREDISNTSRSSSMILQETSSQLETPISHDIDDFSSNSVGTRSDTDFDDDFMSKPKKDNNSEPLTPKSNRTVKSSVSEQSSEKSSIPSTRSSNQKLKPVIFRSKKIAPAKHVPVKNKTNELYNSSSKQSDRPKDVLNHCLSQFDSPNWETTVNGIKLFVLLIRNHPDIVESQIHLLATGLAKHVKNLRSQVSRAACQAAGELYSTHKKCIETESEDLVTSLLHRTADTNKFLRADAGRALESMCDNLHPSKVIQIITSRGACHQNAAVRTTAAKLLNRLVCRLGCDKVFSMNKDCRDKIIINSANLLQEGSLETRNYAKDIFKQLSPHSSYSKVIFDVIPQRTYRNIEKTLKNIK